MTEGLQHKLKGIVLVSGGMDSLVTAAVAKQECEEIFFLHVNYGQLTEVKELYSFNKLVEHFQPKRTMISSIEYLKQIGDSSLLDTSIKMDSDSSTINNKEIPNTYVPFRNAHFLAIATSWAEALKADRIYIGIVEVDGSGYPDCRQEFIDSFNLVIEKGTKNDQPIVVVAPLVNLTKKEIVLLGDKLNVPFELSWSCYRNNEMACGTCPSCQIRLKAFSEAGLTDPILYKI
ncbi:MAG: 7-cyano-7-deazaguanine synthase QueC [Candidatus Cloacimonadia bacterium]